MTRVIEYIRYMLITTILVAVLVSCDEEPVVPQQTIIPEPEKAPTFTMMYYAAGGGEEDTQAGRGLDEAIERSINYLEQRGLKKNLKFTGCIKWSKGYTSELSNGEGNTYRFMLDSLHTSYDFEKIGDNSFPINDPKNIADFIKWSKEIAPADQYILVLSGHGNGWHPQVGLDDTRGILRDTDLGKYISCKELSEGIKESDTEFRMIYLASCLMNTIEYITELSQYCDYTLASSHISVMFGSELNYLQLVIEDIKTDSDKEFVGAINDYLYGNIGPTITNTEYVFDSLDFSLTDCSKVEDLVNATKSLCDTLIALYDEQDEIGADAFKYKYGATIEDMEEVLAKTYYFLGAYMNEQEMAETEYLRMSFTYDLVDIANKVASTIDHDELKAIAKSIKEASNNARICKYTTPSVKDVYYSITLTNATKWQERKYGEAGYENCLFDQKTGWSRFLKRNNIPLKH